MREFKTQRQNEILEGVNKIFQAALFTHTIGDMGRICLGVAEEITQSKFGFIGELNSEGLEEIAVSNPGWDVCKIVESGGHSSPLGSFKLHGIYGRVLKDGKGLFTNDPASHPDRIGFPAGHPPLKAFLGVPLKREGKTIGIVAVGNREGGYTSNQLESLEALAPAIVEAFLRKRAEQALSENEAKYRALFANMLDGFELCRMVFDIEGKPIDFVYLEVNDAFEKLTGLKKEAVVGKRVTEVVPGIEKANPELFEIYGRVALTGKEKKFEIYSNPLELWLSIGVYSPEKGYFVALFDNITDRKKAEIERDIMFEFLRIANGTTCTCDLIKGAVDFFQKQSGCEAVGVRLKEGDDYPYYETKGFPPKHVQLENKLCAIDEAGCVIRDFKGDTVIECMCGNVICGRFDPSKKFFTEKGSFWTNNTTQLLVTTTDADRQVHTRNRCNGEGYESVALLPLQVGNTRFGLLQLNDKRENMFTLEKIQMWERIADRLALALSRTIAEEALQKSELQYKGLAEHLEVLVEERTKQLRDAERLAAIGATAGMVGHDIRNPLQAITSDVYLLRSEVSSLPESEEKESIKESLEGIDKNAQYINKIVQDLQDYSKQITPAALEIDLEVLCEDVLFKNDIPDNIEASCQVEKKAKKIVTDPDLLKRILINLVNNAVQAMPEGGKLVLHAYQEEANTVLTISDTGVGIPDEVKPKLFTPLFTTKSRGQGFGLAVIKRITAALGGTVAFESEVGKCTTFILRLPSRARANTKPKIKF